MTKPELFSSAINNLEWRFVDPTKKSLYLYNYLMADLPHFFPVEYTPQILGSASSTFLSLLYDIISINMDQ